MMQSYRLSVSTSVKGAAHGPASNSQSLLSAQATDSQSTCVPWLNPPPPNPPTPLPPFLSISSECVCSATGTAQYLQHRPSPLYPAVGAAEYNLALLMCWLSYFIFKKCVHNDQWLNFCQKCVSDPWDFPLRC